MLPSLDSCRCFVEAARYLNFRKAAKSVGLSPPAFGKRIRQLEVTALDKMKDESAGHELDAFIDWDPHRDDFEP